MTGEPGGRVRQRVQADRDANAAGRDQAIYNGPITYIGSGTGGEAPVVPGMLPRDVPIFTGRVDELERLTALAGGGRVVVTVIGGTAGAGKTALAVHAAHRLLPGFPGGQLYADLRGYAEDQNPAEPGEVLEVFLRRLGVAAEEVPAGTGERSGMLRGLLASRRVLVLLDNARSEAQVNPLLPGAGESLVLVTSRSPLPGLAADARLMLDALPEEDAARLLSELAGEDRAAAEPDAAALVRGFCGGLPLALRIAGQLLAAHPSWPVSKLERMLAGERHRLDRLEAGDLQVRAAFEVSYRQLGEADARLFRLLGLHPGPDFGPDSAAALAGVAEEEAERILGRLAEACLVTEDRAGRFGMHDLLRLFARGTCHDTDDEAAREAAETRLVTWYADMAGFLDSCLDPRRRPAAEQAAGRDGVPLPSLREALVLFDAERRGVVAAAGLAARRGQDDLVVRLSESAGEAMAILRALNDLLVLREAALAAARRARDTAGEGRALGSLGNAYRELRRFEEAVTCHERSLAIRREAGDRQGEGQTLSNLGVDYGELRRFEEAVACHEESLAIRREIGDRHGEGRALTELGNAYRELRRFEEAVACHEGSLAIRREAGDRLGEGGVLNNLGNAYRELRRFEEAVACYEQSLAIYREAGHRHSESVALNNLGAVNGELRRFEEAVACYEQSLAVYRKIGDRHGEDGALNNLGVGYGGLRRFEEAVACHEGSLAICREIGDRHGEGLALNNLGNAYQNLGRFEEAVTCHEGSLAIRREAGDRHGEGITLHDLGNAYQGLRRFEEAVACCEGSLAIRRETGDRHGEGLALNNLGNAYQNLGRFGEAVACYEQSLAIRRETGDRHGEGTVLYNLGNAYRDLRRSEEAVACYEQSLVICRDGTCQVKWDTGFCCFLSFLPGWMPCFVTVGDWLVDPGGVG
jgi:tetratricopeptide (TPR) repeat protein